MAMVRIPFTRYEVGCLRLTLRLLTVERMFDITKAARDASREDATDSKVLADLLAAADVWHMHDRLLWNMSEATAGSMGSSMGSDEVAINMGPEPIEFYRGILGHKFEVAGIQGVGDVFQEMVETCKKNQAPLLKKINDAVAHHDLKTVPINVFRPSEGRN